MPRTGFFDSAAGRAMAISAAAILALRIWALIASPLDLHFDEAQYWLWSRTLDWGYFSKPPLIAWAIAATTAAFGDGEWAVRLAAPIAHCLGALALFALGRRLYGESAGLGAGALWLTLPAVFVSSAIMSTDALMLPLWSAALFCLWRLTETRGWGWAVLLGVSLGFGALAKYAMLYFLLCAGLAALWHSPTRAALLSWRGAAAGAIALCILAPNLLWNAAHGFETVRHTAANANLDHLFQPDEVFEFLGSQIGVLGPVLFGALGWLLFVAARAPRALKQEERFLIAFVLPPLLIIIAQAILSRAHANWAAAAYPAAMVWLAGRLSASSRGRHVLIAALATHLAIGAAIVAMGVSPMLADRAGLSNALKRTRGWEESAAITAARARADDYSAIIVDHRGTYFELAYYLRDELDELPPLRMWLVYGAAANHAEANAPVRDEDGVRALSVQTVPRYAEALAGDFQSYTPLGTEIVPLGREERALTFGRAEGFQPAVRDDAFRARIEEAED